MSSIDDRIVRMEFDNSRFKKDAAETKQVLEEVNQAVDDSGNTRGLLELDKNMGKVAVTASRMSVVTTTALATITAKATSGIVGMGKNILGTMVNAGKSRALAIEQAQFQFRGLGLDVERMMKQANYAVDGTAYGLQEAATAAAQFGGSGIKMGKDMKTALRSISGLASQTGRSYGEIAQVMTGIAGVGKVTGQDLVQFGVRGLNAAAIMGKQWKKTEGQVREMVKRGEVDFATFAKAMDKAFGANATKANETFTGAQANLNAVFSRFGAGFQEHKLEAQRRIFVALIPVLKEVHNALKPMQAAFGERLVGWADRLAKAISKIDANRLTKAFFPLGRAMGNLVSPFVALGKVLGGTFVKVFGGGGSSVIGGIEGTTSAIENLTKPVRWLANGIEGAAPAVELFFRLIKMGFNSLKDAGGNVMDFVSNLGLFSNLSAPSGGFMGWVTNLPGRLNEAIKKINEMLEAGASLKDVFSSFNLKLPSMPKLPGGLGDLFGGKKEEEASGLAGVVGIVENLTGKVEDLGEASKKAVSDGVFNPEANIDTKQIIVAGEDLGEAADQLDESKDKVKTSGEGFMGVLEWIGERISSFFKGFDAEDLVASANLAILGTFLFTASRFLNKLTDNFKVLPDISALAQDFMGQVGAAVKAFNKQANARLIVSIAIAIGILAASLWLLSRIPWPDMIKGLTGLGALMLFMLIAVKQLVVVIEKMEADKAGIKLMQLGVALTLVAIAMTLLAVAFKKLAKIDFADILKGLGTMAAAVGIMGLFSKFGQGAGGAGMIQAAFAILTISAALIVMAHAFKKFNDVNWGSMIKAATAISGISLVLGIFTGLVMGTGGAGGAAILASAAAIAIVSWSLGKLADALIKFDDVNWGSMGKAAAALVGLAVGLTLMTAGVIGGAALPAIAMGLAGLAGALKLFEFVNWKAIGMMVAAMAGLSVGLLILAPALWLISPALVLFSVAVLAIAAAMWLMAQALEAFVPIAATASATFAALAMGFAIGVGVFFQTLAAQAPVIRKAVLKLIDEMFKTLIAGVPMIIRGVRQLWQAVIKELTGDKQKDSFKKSGETWIERLERGIDATWPGLVRIVIKMILQLLREVEKKAEDFGEVGASIIANFIQGIANNLDQIIQSGANLIIAWIQGIGSMSADIAEAAMETVVKFVEDMSTAIENNTDPLIDAMIDLGWNLISGLAKGITRAIANFSPVGMVTNLVKNMIGAGNSEADTSSPSKKMIKLGRFMVEGLTIGIQNHTAAAIRAIAATVSGQIAMATRYISGFVQKLDQRAIAARAQAEGLAEAAQRAANLADKTKSKKDDKAAKRLAKRANEANKKAERAEARAEKAAEAADRRGEFREADLITKAQMRSEDAQSQIDEAKKYELRAAKNLAKANALEKQSQEKGVTKKQREQLQKEIDRLRKNAEKDTARMHDKLNAAKRSAADALRYQQLAGAEAAKAFQSAYDAQAKAAAEEDAFEKLNNIEKAELRRKQAEELQKAADADLEAAKKLAYTDLEGANALAEQALEKADQARQYLKEAEGYDSSGIQGVGSGGNMGTVVNLDSTDAASVAMGDYAELYSSATAAAAAGTTVEFTQYNTSPEALSPIELYRQTNNLLRYAADQISAA